METILKADTSNLQSFEAEEAVIGAMLLSREVISDVTEILTEEDFAMPQLKEIFSAIMDLFEEGKPVDVITVAERLRERGTFDAVGGSEYLTSLVINTPTTANATYYAKIIKEKSLLRQGLNKCEELTKAYQEGNITRIQQLLDDLLKIKTVIESGQFDNLLPTISLEKAYEKELSLGMNKWRIHRLLPAKGLILLCGRPKKGKTAILCKIIAGLILGKNCFQRNVYQESEPKILWITNENTAEELRNSIKLYGDIDTDKYIRIIDIEKLEAISLFNIDTIVNTAKYHSCNLIIIEPLTLLNEVMQAESKKNANFDQVYGTLIRIRQKLIKENLSLIGVRHSKKGTGVLYNMDDVIDSPMGSTAYPSAADAIIGFGLPPNTEKDTQRRIMAIGRGVYLDYLLDYDEEQGYIELGDYENETSSIKLSENQRKIYEYLKKVPIAKPHEIAKETGINFDTVRTILYRLTQRGLITKSDNGYSLLISNSNNETKNINKIDTHERNEKHETFETVETYETSNKVFQNVSRSLKRSEVDKNQGLEVNKSNTVSNVSSVSNITEVKDDIKKTVCVYKNLSFDKQNEKQNIKHIIGFDIQRFYVLNFSLLTTEDYREAAKHYKCECGNILEYGEAIDCFVCKVCRQIYRLIPGRTSDIEGGKLFIELKKLDKEAV
ncbi:DnaB-like helicase N-terminal domain-containing protein [Caldicellulosiruptor acetigenus]|uniref:DnaB-like helicase N-terminal domain-containing protein n=1 Tax=Caldicellulosiruptor acetigenus TaxID=301953 RepID=UPI0003FC90A0|nr:DnaB-like helicase N-terminal domain-containing protein [Caldicellulosiruptor acetigenus]WAM35885.1 AAA family ATPase [Caldicellulosiruptor acetigenus]